MRFSQIYEEVLLLDKTITVEFNSLKEFNTFKVGLHISRARTEKHLKSLGFSEGKDFNISIFSKVVSSNTKNPPFTVEFCMKEKDTPKYKIISITDNDSKEVD